MDREPLKDTFYTPGSKLKNPGSLAREMLADLIAARGLAWRLFLRNLSSQYRQTVLGYVWLFLPPLATTIAWVFLNSQNILNVGVTEVPYPVYVLSGTLLWQGFVDALNSPMQVVQESRAMLTKVNFPREALILSGLGSVIFNFIIRMVLLAGLFLYYKIPLKLNMLFAPIGFVGLMLFGLTVGLLLLPLATLYGDVQRGLQIITGFWFFLTPVVYTAPTSWPASLVSTLNPVSPLLLVARQWLVGMEASNLYAFSSVMFITLCLTLAGWLVFRLAMPMLIERIGS
jgi:lipopolysaccharide transport system permease protein